MTVIFAGLAGAFLLMIVFEWGAQGDFFRDSGPKQGVIGEVNGYEIMSEEYENQYQQSRQELMERQKKTTLTEAEEQESRDNAWDELVMAKLTEEQMDKYEIEVSDQEIRELIQEQPQVLMNMGYLDRQAFTDSATGAFKKQEYVQALQDPRNDTFVSNITKFLRYQLRRTKFYGYLQALARTTTPELWERFAIENAKATANVVVIKPTAKTEELASKVTDEEIQKYYEDHKHEHKQEAGKRIRLVMFQETATLKDSATMYDRLQAFRTRLAALPLSESDSIIADMARDITDEKVEPAHVIQMQEMGLFANNAEIMASSKPGDIHVTPFGGGFSILRVKEVTDTGAQFSHVRHILLSFEKFNNNPDSALSVANAIMAQLQSGANFAQLAQRYSHDPGSAQKGGDLGWADPRMFVGEFKSAVEGASLNKAIGPFKTQFGYHIIEVLGRSTRKLIGTIINVPTKASSTTVRMHEQQARLFRDKALKIGFEEAAKEMRLQIPPDVPVVRKNEQPLFGYKPIINYIFKLSPGDISEPIKIPQAKVITVMEVIEDVPKGTRPLDDQGKTQIRQLLAQRKAVDAMEQTAKSLHAMIGPGESLDKLGAVDTNYKPKVVTMGPAEGTMAFQTDYVVNNTAFALKPGEISQPLKGDNAWYIVQGVSVAPASKEQFEKDKLTLYGTYNNEKQQRFFGQWFQKMKNIADVKDYRIGY